MPPNLDMIKSVSMRHYVPNMGDMSRGDLTHLGAYSNVPKEGISNYMKCPNRLKELREAAGLSHEKLAKLAGTIRGQIYKLETGERKLTHTWMIKLAPHLHCNPEDLISVKSSNPISDAEVALTEAVKVMMQIFLYLGVASPESFINAFGAYRADYQKKNLLGGALVMEQLIAYASEEPRHSEQEVLGRLLKLHPVLPSSPPTTAD